MMTDAALDNRLEHWARWVHGGACPAKLDYAKTAPGFRERTGQPHGPLLTEDGPEAVEAAVSQLQVKGHGLYDDVRRKWIRKPRKAYAQCAEVLRAEYRAHPAYGDARFEETGNATEKTLARLGISQRTYYRKLALAKDFIREVLA